MSELSRPSRWDGLGEGRMPIRTRPKVCSQTHYTVLHTGFCVDMVFISRGKYLPRAGLLGHMLSVRLTLHFTSKLSFQSGYTRLHSHLQGLSFPP